MDQLENMILLKNGPENMILLKNGPIRKYDPA